MKRAHRQVRTHHHAYNLCQIRV